MISYFSPLINLSLTTCSHDEEDGHDDGLSSRTEGHLVPGLVPSGEHYRLGRCGKGSMVLAPQKGGGIIQG